MKKQFTFTNEEWGGREDQVEEQLPQATQTTKGGSDSPGTLEGRNKIAKLLLMFIVTLAFKNT